MPSELQYMTLALVGLLVLAGVLVMRNTGIHDIDANGVAGSNFTQTITVPSVTSYKFRIRNATTYSGISDIGVYSISGSVDPVSFTILESAPTVYTANVNGSNAYVSGFTGSVSADTVYYVQFASAVTSFNIHTND